MLANSGNADALRALREEVEKHLWASLRALRISMVLDPWILAIVLDIVRQSSDWQETYDAIIALGEIPEGSPEAEEATEVLVGYVRRHRWPMYDATRTNALVSLGYLQSNLAVPVLVEELTDENPMIVLQAARALQSVLDSRAACRRILEAATAGTRPPQAYAGALRALKRKPVVAELEAALSSGPTLESDAALTLLRELGGVEALDRLRAVRRTAEEYIKAQSEADAGLRGYLDRSLTEARHGFRIATAMDIAVFVAGYVILGLGVFLVLSADDASERLVGAVTSGTGFVGVLLKNWLLKARERIEPSVRRFVTIQATLNGYLRQLRHVDQAYTQRLLEGDLELEDVREYTEIVREATRQAMAFLNTSGDEHAEDVDASRTCEQAS
jgi:hypothetical protein